MDLESLANLAEIIGAVAVIVSLVYLATQIRQGNIAQRTENYARVMERFAQLQTNFSQNGPFTVIYGKGLEDMTSLTPKERFQVVWCLHEQFDCFEFLFQSARNGTIPEEVWDRWSEGVAFWLSYPGVREWWSAKPIPYTKSFTKFVEQAIANNPTPSDAAERWKRFVRSGYSLQE